MTAAGLASTILARHPCFLRRSPARVRGEDGMTTSQLPATDTSRELPVFALPEYALFPHTLVPFHVFEERYCGMLESCLAERRLLVVAGLKPGWERAARWGAEGSATAQAPALASAHEPIHEPIYEIGGLGRVLSDRRFPDGRYNVFVHCIARVRVVRTHRVAPYQVVDVERLPDLDERPDEALWQRVLALATGLVRAMGPSGTALGKMLGSSDDAAVLTNRLASVLLTEPPARQALLETLSPARRAEVLARRLAAELMEHAEVDPAGPAWLN